MPDPSVAAPHPPIVVTPRPATFAALGITAFRRLWVTGVIVFFAVTAQQVARGWLAKDLTGTNAGLGGVMLGFGVAMLLATPFGGVVADRLSKRLVIIAASLTMAVSSATIGIAVALDGATYWMLIAVAMVQAVTFAFYGPSRMAMVGDMLDGPLLANGVVLGQMSLEGMRVIGPALAGVLIASFDRGLEAVFLASAGACALASVVALRLPHGRSTSTRARRAPWHELADGLRYVRREPGLALLLMTSLGVVMIGYSYLTFLPTIAVDRFDAGSGGYGLLIAAGAIGAVAAALVAARGRDPQRLWRTVSIAGMAFGLSLMALGLAPTFPVALAVMPLIGATSLTFQTGIQSLLLGLSALEYHGRIQSLVLLGFSGFGIAGLPLGLAADAVGLRAVLIAMGGGVLATMAVFVLRHQRVMASRPPVAFA